MFNNTYNWLFFLSLSNLLCRFWSLKKTKAIMYASIKQSWFLWNTVWFVPEPSQNFEVAAVTKNTYNVPFLILFEHTSMPTKIRIQTKTIWHSITCDTHIISWNYDISCSLACQKTWGKELKHLKTLRIVHFFFSFNTLPCICRS